MSSLELNALYKRFGAAVAVDNLCLSVPSGSRLSIVGASGSGKTTLLRMIAGFEFADSGRITLGSQTLFDGNLEVPAHRRRIGYVPQDGALFPHMTVAGNIGFGLGKGLARAERMLELMDMVALDANMLERWPHELSGGQQQRVALARALAQKPALMLLDEPFSALDTGLRTSMRKAVSRLLSEARITTILVTHDQGEALSFGDQLAIMRHGKLVQAGQPQALYQHPVDEATALFLGDAVVLPAFVTGGRAACVLGQIPVIDPGLTGDARIMLRPEQLLFTDTSGLHTQLPFGRVIDTDYSGSSSVLTIEISGAEGLPVVFQARCSHLATPQKGSTVYVSVQGQAHVLEIRPLAVKGEQRPLHHFDNSLTSP